MEIVFSLANEKKLINIPTSTNLHKSLYIYSIDHSEKNQSSECEWKEGKNKGESLDLESRIKGPKGGQNSNA